MEAKRLLIVCMLGLLLSVNVQLWANPIAVGSPKFYASELIFDSEGKWVIELRSYAFDITEVVDSVRITTSGGSAKWNKLSFGSQENGYVEQPEVFIVRNDSLDSDLSVSPEGDYIQVTTYYKWGLDSISYTLIFGNYPGATVRSPKAGESIVRAGEYYCIDVTPTIGLPNDEEGMFTTVTFNIYYPDKQLFYFSDVRLFDANHLQSIPIYKNEDGSYSGNLYYCHYLIDKLYIKNRFGEYNEYWEFQNPINCRMDNLIDWGNEITIRIDLDRFTDIQAVQIEETVLKIIPNPITNNTFNYETILPVKAAKSIIEVVGLNGQIITQYPINENKGRITLPSNIAKGIYNAVLTVNKKKYAVAKIIIQ